MRGVSQLIAALGLLAIIVFTGVVVVMISSSLYEPKTRISISVWGDIEVADGGNRLYARLFITNTGDTPIELRTVQIRPETNTILRLLYMNPDLRRGTSITLSAGGTVEVYMVFDVWSGEKMYSGMDVEVRLLVVDPATRRRVWFAELLQAK